MRKEYERSSRAHAAWRALAAACFLLPVLANAQKADVPPCTNGVANCLLAVHANSAPPAGSFESAAWMATSSRVVSMYVRTLHRGPFAHHWIELDSSRGPVTVGFGPATIPFIAAGQISIWRAGGKVERVGKLPFISANFNYAKPPGIGYPIGQPITLTLAQSDALIAKERHRKFIFPYIPIFHDCRTFVCAVKASVAGKSTLPCYLLFKGYW